MKFSLIVPTIGRTEELRKLLASLAAQTMSDFEVILSDQNPDDRIVTFLQSLTYSFPIIHLRSSGGASRARNVGMDRATGEFITFPDDDCAYTPDLLQRVLDFFSTHPEYGYLTGSSYDEWGHPATHFTNQGNVIRPCHVQGIEYTFFARTASLGSLRYDENMGVGCPTPWQADEGQDLWLRLSARGVAGYYEPTITIWHPRKVIRYEPHEIDRSYRYACGNGYFLKKHGHPFWFILYLQVRSFAGVFVGLARLNPAMMRFYLARWNGRWRGWFGYDRFQREQNAAAS